MTTKPVLIEPTAERGPPVAETASLPNLIICGVPKAATSSLFAWLSDHPEVRGSSVKETRYFVDPESHAFDHRHNFRAGGLDGYRFFFPVDPRGTPQKLLVEATPIYIFQKTALKELPKLPSNPKFLFVLRRPAMQIYSTYTYFTNNHIYMDRTIPFREFVAMARNHAADLSSNELLQYALDHARYADYLVKWRDRVGADRMIVLLFEDLVGNPRTTLKTVARATGLSPDFYDDYTFPRRNETYRARSTFLQRINQTVRDWVPGGWIRNRLRSIYRTVNTEQKTRPSDDDRAMIAALDAEFENANRLLAREFNLDVSPWTG